jgi:hypothetical protein
VSAEECVGSRKPFPTCSRQTGEVGFRFLAMVECPKIPHQDVKLEETEVKWRAVKGRQFAFRAAQTPEPWCARGHCVCRRASWDTAESLIAPLALLDLLRLCEHISSAHSLALSKKSACVCCGG